VNAVDAAMTIAGEVAELQRLERGRRFDPYLVEPPLRTSFRDPIGNTWQLWMVLRMPNDEYIVAFDDGTNEFFLVIDDELRASFPTLAAALGVT
jgi:hypothetical protein